MGRGYCSSTGPRSPLAAQPSSPHLPSHCSFPSGTRSWSLQGQILPPGGPLPATQGHQPSCRPRGAGARRLWLPASSARRPGHPVPELPDPVSSTAQRSTARPALRQRGPAASPPAATAAALAGLSQAVPGSSPAPKQPWEQGWGCSAPGSSHSSGQGGDTEDEVPPLSVSFPWVVSSIYIFLRI